jgi:hypothetical protein
MAHVGAAGRAGVHVIVQVVEAVVPAVTSIAAVLPVSDGEPPAEQPESCEVATA